MPDAVDALPPLRANRAFRVLSIAQSSSELGSSMIMLVIPLLGYALTRSTGLAGVITMMVFAARLILTLPTGGVIDRHRRKSIIISCAAVGAVTSALIAALTFLGILTVPLLMAAAVLWGGANNALKSAFGAALRDAVDARQRPRANAMRQARIQGVDIVGPPVGCRTVRCGPRTPLRR